MRIRTIKPDFFKHYELYMAELETGLPLRLAFAGLWGAADREGRFRWQPERLKIDVLPYDNLDFSRVLDALTTRGFLVKYMSRTGALGVIPTFKSHQIVNNRESASILPPPPILDENLIENNMLTREPRVDDASLTALNLDRVEQEQEQEHIYPYSPQAGDVVGLENSGSQTKKESRRKKAQHDSSAVLEIFDYWRVQHKHEKSTLDKKRSQAINSRLAEGYSLERLKDAIDGIRFSSHHMGKNDRNTVYDDIELICRSGANVDKFADLKDKFVKPKPVTPPQELVYESIFAIREYPDLSKRELKTENVIPTPQNNSIPEAATGARQ